jgi:hypothetical protein
LANVILAMTYGELKQVAEEFANVIEPDVRPKMTTPEEFMSRLEWEGVVRRRCHNLAVVRCGSSAWPPRDPPRSNSIARDHRPRLLNLAGAFFVCTCTRSSTPGCGTPNSCDGAESRLSVFQTVER